MDIESILSNANPDITIFLLTTLVAFISWLLKSLVEKPIVESKNTFNKFLEKRIEILTEVKTRLNFIAYFPSENDSLEYKNQLQEIILKDGKTGYLNKNTFDSVLKISIDPITDNAHLHKTINEINDDLYSQISKIQDEISFYRKYSNYNPLKRFIGLTFLMLLYLISFCIVISVLIFFIIYFIEFNIGYKLGIMIAFFTLLFFTNKWLKN